MLWKYQLWFTEESSLSVASFSPLYVHFRKYNAQNPRKNYTQGLSVHFKPLKKMPAPSISEFTNSLKGMNLLCGSCWKVPGLEEAGTAEAFDFDFSTLYQLRLK